MKVEAVLDSICFIPSPKEVQSRWDRHGNYFTTNNMFDSVYFAGLAASSYGTYAEKGNGHSYKGEFVATEGLADDVDAKMRAFHPNKPNIIKALLRIS